MSPWFGFSGPLQVSSTWGPRKNPVTGASHFHNGIDLPMPQGTPILPIAAGRVARTWLDDPVNGTAVRIDHGGGWQSSYVHLSRLDVVPGQAVDRSAPLGLSGGKPGTWGAGRSTGPHLHLTLWRVGPGGQLGSVDPLPAIDWRPFVVEVKGFDGVYRPVGGLAA